ncbi:MAG: DUF4112 domain-containing protein [Bacteroidia bacterium]
MAEENKKDLKYIEKVTHFLDSQFRIPGTDVRVGIDPIIGFFIPILGDIISYIMSALLVFYMIKNGASGKVVMKILVNLLIDLLIGGVPMVGQIGDFFYKANERNLKLYKEYLNEGKHEGSALPYILAIVFILILIPIIFLVVFVKLFYELYEWIF